MKNIRVLGAGFSCMDIVNYADSSYVSLGGTTANVMTILSQFGFETQLLTAEYIGDMADWYKKALEIRNITPIYFQKSKKRISVVIEDVDSINNTHRFKTSCPVCKNSLINITLPSTQKIVELEVENSNLLFYDRFSSGIKHLANANQNGWKMYEPNAFRMYVNLLNGCQAADIIKFSAERIPESVCTQLLHDLEKTKAQIVIVTMGKDGLKFTVKKEEYWGEWNYISSINNTDVVDTAGAGDWLTASFLYEFLSEYPLCQSVSEEKIKEKLQQAQILATMACGFVGAQGILKDSVGVELLNSNTGQKFWKLHDQNIVERLKCPICGYCEI